MAIKKAKSDKHKTLLNFNYKLLNVRLKRDFQIKFEDFEPYDLSAIKNIVDKTLKKVKNQNKLDTKIAYLLNAIDKIMQIMINNENVYQVLLQEGEILDPDDNQERQNELCKADNLKKRLESLIVDLRFQNEYEADVLTIHKSEPDTVNDVKTPISDLRFYGDLLKKSELSKVLGYRSTSTIDHWDSQNPPIPYVTIGKSKRYRKEDIINYLNRGNSKIETIDKSKPFPGKNKKEENHFIFTEPLEPYVRAFVDKGYLDEENATLMIDRFSLKPKLGDQLIQWKKEINSLMTFIYLADRLGFIDKSMPTDVRPHNTSANETKELNAGENEEIRYIALVSYNFRITSGGKGDSTISNKWEAINKSVINMRNTLANARGIKEDVEAHFTRKEAIFFYFMNKDVEYFTLTKETDRNMLNIFCNLINLKKNA